MPRFFFIIFLLSCATAYGQDATTNHANTFSSDYITGGAGIAIPQGTYKSTNFNNIHAGFANKGYTAFLEFAKPIHKSRFGIIANLSYYYNSINTSEAFAFNDAAFPEMRNLKLGKPGGYQLIDGMFGGYISVPYKRFSIALNVMVGINATLIPAQSNSIETLFSLHGPTPPTYFTQQYSAETRIAPAFSDNLTIRYRVHGPLSVFVRAGLLYSTCHKALVHIDGYDVDNNGTEHIQLFSSSLGISYQLK